ncbi:carbohydrate kinase family protein [Ornithinibacillus californiensis]|uniref:carbohydrate kinase family protein n=1 Tax=Ornithinibacillus californiensis TaxID=161536 RepID=UPI00064D9359|nr:carbohydrate kinase [Ornithinibacillus californiensis]
MNDVTALGEILIDFTPIGKNEQGNPVFEANPGGAPGNVLVALSNLGMRTNFIGCIGRDSFGDILLSTLKSKNVQTEGIVYSEVNTTLAFVHIDDHGERSFSFYRNPGADMMLAKEDINFDIIANSRIFHVGSLSMTDEPSRTATIEALEYAKLQKVKVSFDVNLRPPLWGNLENAKQEILTVMKYADIVKVSEEELEFLTGTDDIKTGAKELYETYNLFLLFVTSGSEGSYVFHNGELSFCQSYKVKAVDTTGCGDAFFAGVLHYLLVNNLLNREIAKESLLEVLQFGNAMGAYVAERRGGIPSMPALHQIEDFLIESIERD